MQEPCFNHEKVAEDVSAYPGKNFTADKAPAIINKVETLGKSFKNLLPIFAARIKLHCFYFNNYHNSFSWLILK